jgi:lysine 6-dehydrogenase
MKIIVLGGAGKMGSVAVQDLAHDDRVDDVVIADYDIEGARGVAGLINSPKISIEQVDANNHHSLVNVLQGADACLNATVYYFNLNVMEACLEAKVAYTDLGGLFHLTRKELELHDRFADAGVSAVIGMGSAPGVPNLQASYAADRLDTIDYIRIYDGIKPPSPDNKNFSYAVPTIIDELTTAAVIFRDGKWVEKEPVTEFEDYWFAEPIGLLPMHLTLHSEPATLAAAYQHKGVKECFFKINYWGMAKEMVEKIKDLIDFGFAGREPVDVNGKEVVPRDLLVKLMSGYVPDVSDLLAPPANKPPDWVKEIVTEVHGSRDGKEMTYWLGTVTVKGALPTGVVPARAAIWLSQGRVPAGVYPPERAIDPIPFLKELENRDIYTNVTVTECL